MKTITALYDTHDDAHLAVKALEDAGVPSDHISIVSYKDGKKEVEGQGNDAAEGAGTGASIGAVVGGTGGLLTGLGMLAIPGVGPVVAAGWLAALAAGVLFVATSAMAQSQTPSTTQTTPAVSTSGEQNPGAPVAGKNSFTEDQAKSRIEGAGFSDVTDLELDDQGVWRSTATKDGKQVAVSLDFQGNVTQAK